MILTVLLLGIAAAYPLRSLMLFQRDDHFGPLPDYRRWVRFKSTGHVQPVTMFDWIRRFGRVYIVTKDPVKSIDWWWWDVREGHENFERFTCPHCLSWWTAIPFSVGFTLHVFGLTPALLWIVPIHFAIAIVSQLCYEVLWGDEDE